VDAAIAPVMPPPTIATLFGRDISARRVVSGAIEMKRFTYGGIFGVCRPCLTRSIAQLPEVFASHRASAREDGHYVLRIWDAATPLGSVLGDHHAAVRVVYLA